MQLERHLLVLWRFRGVVAGGVLLGILLAVLAAYQVSWKDGSIVPSLAARGEEQWSAGSRVLVTQEGFPEGRVTLPGAVPGEESQPAPDDTKRGGIKYADPARFATLSALYAVIARSDQVRARLREKVDPEQIQAVPLDLTGSGDQFLPIVEITTTAVTETGARRLNRETVRALRGLLTQEQAENRIPKDSRVQLTTLNDPRTQLVSGRAFTGSILAFILCVLAAIALAHVLESLLAPAPVAVLSATSRRAEAELDEAEPPTANGHSPSPDDAARAVELERQR